ncbi:hypothetical protein [Curtobacterium sp. MMLR14_010]|uniref:hypothetical protein n=1 Tax=Curtobacterium sp. MMLR14_010 TaxID=1898743 RepID=UPI001113FE04|nr:hypothetical protein [Curtobacterium sp. MMLR14_010]
MTNPRLELALKQLHAGVWRDFEMFAAEFLAVEYPSLRSTAGANGDRGRDGEVYSIDGAPSIGAQYSVAQDFNAKIIGTLSRLKDEGLNYTHLIYATNQYIGADGDKVRERARVDFQVILDVRDRSWFLERENTYPQRAAASERLIARYADPLLAASGLRERTGTALSQDDGRVALLHLALENRDVETDRSLTRSCFDALVLAALHDTDSANTKTLKQLQEDVGRRVPTGVEGQVEALVAGTLKRLAKKGPIKHLRDSDSFHLAYGAAEEMKAKAAQFLLEENEVGDELRSVVEDTLGSDRAAKLDLAELRNSVEAVLFDRGEAFVATVNNGVPFQVDPDQVAGTLQRRKLPALVNLNELTAIVLAVLRTANVAVRRHLARLGDAYTLFAFLRQTPDVQKVVVEIFSEGDIWLDTSVVLPLIGETLIDDPSRREFTLLMRAASDAGLRLHVTEGVVEEVERHLNRGYVYASTNGSDWRGRIPFLYTAYVLSGGLPSQFNDWRNEFAGRSRPEEDVSDYLEEEFSISTRSLLHESDNAPLELRAALQELWNEAHDRRRTESSIRHRLVAHDVENSVGVIQYRKSLARSPMGHRAWWLTVDKTASRLGVYIKDRLGSQAPDSPTLSPDFLAQLIRLGPLRKAIEHETLIDLPSSTDMTLFDYATPALLAEAESVREKTHTDSERLLKRGVRDEMDRRRRQLGPAAVGGARALEARVLSAIEGKPAEASNAESSPVV